MFTLFASHDANGENGLDVMEVGDDEKDGLVEVEPSLLDTSSLLRYEYHARSLTTTAYAFEKLLDVIMLMYVLLNSV